MQPQNIAAPAMTGLPLDWIGVHISDRTANSEPAIAIYANDPSGTNDVPDTDMNLCALEGPEGYSEAVSPRLFHRLRACRRHHLLGRVERRRHRVGVPLRTRKQY